MTTKRTSACDFVGSYVIEMATSNCRDHEKRVLDHLRKCEDCKEKFIYECRIAGNTEGLKIFSEK